MGNDLDAMVVGEKTRNREFRKIITAIPVTGLRSFYEKKTVVCHKIKVCRVSCKNGEAFRWIDLHWVCRRAVAFWLQKGVVRCDDF